MCLVFWGHSKSEDKMITVREALPEKDIAACQYIKPSLDILSLCSAT